MENEQNLNKTKKDYEILQVKYLLPAFADLAREMDIERVSERETDYLLREIRKTMVEKIGAYLHLFETFANPATPPMFIFAMLRKVSEENKKDIKDIYKALAKLELEALTLDTIYNEEKEAAFIKEVFSQWSTLKIKINKLMEILVKNTEEDNGSASRGYVD